MATFLFWSKPIDTVIQKSRLSNISRPFTAHENKLNHDWVAARYNARGAQ
jgi:hypothetical protein